MYIYSGGSTIKAARLQTPQIVCRNTLDTAFYQISRAKSDNDHLETFRTRLFGYRLSEKAVLSAAYTVRCMR